MIGLMPLLALALFDIVPERSYHEPLSAVLIVPVYIAPEGGFTRFATKVLILGIPRYNDRPFPALDPLSYLCCRNQRIKAGLVMLGLIRRDRVFALKFIGRKFHYDLVEFASMDNDSEVFNEYHNTSFAEPRWSKPGILENHFNAKRLIGFTNYSKVTVNSHISSKLPQAGASGVAYRPPCDQPKQGRENPQTDGRDCQHGSIKRYGITRCLYPQGFAVRFLLCAGAIGGGLSGLFILYVEWSERRRLRRNGER